MLLYKEIQNINKKNGIKNSMFCMLSFACIDFAGLFIKKF